MGESASKREKATSAEPRAASLSARFEQLPLAELVGRLMERDEMAWRYFWERHAGHCLALIRHLISVRNWFVLRGWEEDVLVESFERLLSGVGKFRGDTYEQLERFIRANVALACLRKLRELGRHAEPMAGSAMDAETLADQTEVAECEGLLRAAVNELPPELREIVGLNLMGYNSKEIASQLAVPRHTVFDRKHRALGLLRDRLSRDGFWEHCANHISEMRFFRGEGEHSG